LRNSCWELVFYALIKSDLLHFADVRSLYERATAPGGHGDNAVLYFLQHAPLAGLAPGTKTLKAQSIADIDDGKHKFHAGDVILIPEQEFPNPDRLDAGVLHHVLIVHKEPAADLKSGMDTIVSTYHIYF
jgi:hypothetical protein